MQGISDMETNTLQAKQEFLNQVSGSPVENLLTPEMIN